jgi:hypothetical protein
MPDFEKKFNLREMKMPAFLIFMVLLSSGYTTMQKDYAWKYNNPGIASYEAQDSTTILKTKTGKTIVIKETHPEGFSTSLIEVIPADFRDSNAIEIGKTDPMARAELTDLDNDGYSELFLFTQSAGSGSSGTVYGFASDKDKRLVKIGIKPNTEEEYSEGGDLEGYMGHDSYHFEKGMLIREFPVYKSNDSNITPTGGTKEVYYKYRNFRLEMWKVVKKEP